MSTYQETDISQLAKGKIIFKSALSGDMLVPWTGFVLICDKWQSGDEPNTEYRGGDLQEILPRQTGLFLTLYQNQWSSANANTNDRAS